jgi:hypothetical protein
MKRAGCFCFILIFLSSIGFLRAQLNYTFAGVNGTYTANASPTSLLGSSVDDNLSSATNIGFTFQYGCTNYTQFKASSNGWLTLNTANTGSTPANNLNTGIRPVIAPLWDDLATNSSGSVNYLLTGSAPNRVLTIEWKQMLWTYSASTYAISFQAKLYETTNIIEFVYLRNGTAGGNISSGASASIGISGTTNGDFYSLDGVGGSPNANYGTETSNLNTKPATGQIYRFTPVQCSGAPSAGTIASNITSGCYGAAVALSVTGSSTGCGISYQWESAPVSAGPWTTVVGATSATYNTTLTSTICYRRITSCSISGLSATTSSACITFSGCYSMSNGITANLPCPSTVSFYDQGGAASDYNTSQNQTMTFTASGSNCLTITFNSFGTETCCDDLTIYDGPNTSGTLIGTYYGSTLPPSITSTTSSLTFVFYSDGSVVDLGWDATITCAAPCTGAPAAGTVTSSKSGSCGSSLTSVLTMTGAAVGCGISYQWQSSPNGTAWTNIAGATSTAYTATVTADTYYRCEVICSGGSSTQSNSVFIDMNNPNLAGTGTVLVSALPYTNYSQTTCGMVNDITSGNVSNICGSSSYYGGEDVVYVFTPTTTGTTTVTMSNTSGTVGFSLYAGCPFTGSCVGTAKSSNASNSICVTVTAGTTYYLVIDSWPSPSCFTYDISISAPVAGIVGNTCANANVISSLPFTQTGLSTCCMGNDYTSANACASSYMNGEDYVFAYTPAANIVVDITISNSLTYTGVFVTQGCPAGGTCVASATSSTGNPSLCAVSLTGGVTYYIIIDNSPSPSCTPFDFNIKQNGTVTSCNLNYTSGAATYNSPSDPYSGSLVSFTDDHFSSSYISIPFDFCFDGVQYTQLLISSNAYLIFAPVGCTGNLPTGNASPGGYSGWSISGAIPNTTNAPRNAILGPWHDIDPGVAGTVYYSTTGTAPNRRFVVSFDNVAMYSCNNQDFKAQIKLFETSHNIEVHISKKTLCSSWNSGKAILGLHNYDGTIAVVPAGYNSPTQWTANSAAWRFTNNCASCLVVLPLELLSFSGQVLPFHNLLDWKIAGNPPKKFIVERSKDGVAFETIGEIIVNDQSSRAFSFTDETPFEGTAYYRISIIDDNGNVESSQVILLSRDGKPFDNFIIYPNPSDGNSTVISFNTVAADNFEVRVFDLIGKKILSKNFSLKSKQSFAFDLNEEFELPRGTYIVELSGSGMRETRRLVIN